MTEKLPIQRFSVALHKLLGVAIPLHLGILKKHKIHIEKFQETEEWTLLYKEQINASRTVQQLKADIRDIEVLRSQVCVDDLPEFENRTSSVRNEILESIAEFISIHKSVLFPAAPLRSSGRAESRPGDSDQRSSNFSNLTPLHVSDEESKVRARLQVNRIDDLAPENSPVDRTSEGQQVQLSVDPSLAHLEEVNASWTNLENDLVELSDLIGTLSTQVSRHQEPIDSIQNNVSAASDNIREGTKQLAIASRLHKAMFPVGGAAMGALVGGPVGFFAGLKIGAAAALTGGAVGYSLGRVIKLKADTTGAIVLKPLDSSVAADKKDS